MKKLILFVLCALSSAMLLAQPITVKGTVIGSEDGLPIIGAYVLQQGTNNGTSTDIDGNFQITVPKTATLVVSSVGFLTHEVPVQGRELIKISLAPETVNLDEVMVVAYGTVKKGSYSGSATMVKEDALKDAPVMSFESVLSGKAPGVQVSASNGQPGAQADISIRGFGSFNAGNQPLYVIDGVPATSGDWSSGNISTTAMSFLNPSDIESITILKDAAAASLYGSRASNGVILITTKKGKQGKVTSTFKASAGVSYFAYDNYELANEQETEDLIRMAWYNYGEKTPSAWNKTYATLSDYAEAKVNSIYPKKDTSKYIYKDWEDVLFRKGVAQNYEYSVSGGGEKGRVYASVAYSDQQGLTSIEYLTRFSATVNGEANVNKFVKVGGNLQYSRTSQSGHQQNHGKDDPYTIWKKSLNPRWPYAYADGSLYTEQWISGSTSINPVGYLDKQINDAKQNRLLLKGWMQVNFTDWLTAKTTVSNDWLNVHDRFGWLYGHPNFYAYSAQGGYMSDRHRNVNRMVSSTTLNFDKTWDKHHVAAMAGWEAESEKYHLTRAGKTGFSYQGATESYFGAEYDDSYSYSRDAGLLSALASLNYDFDNRYYITGTFRRDGSSKLAPETRWGNFWSVSGSWRLSNEAFLKDVEWLNDAKIRGSYGTSGTLPSSYFGFMSTYSYGVYGTEGASYPSSLANADLTWEKNKNWNVAVDATIFDKWTLSAEYFEKETYDLLLSAKIPSITGFTSTLTNIGSMRNRGVEIAVNYDILKSKDWDLSVGANWSTIDNEILSLSTPDEVQNSRPYQRRAGYSFYQYRLRKVLGIAQEDFKDLYGHTIKAGDNYFAEGSYYEKGEIADMDIILKDGTKVAKGEVVPKSGYNYAPTTRGYASQFIIEGKTALPKGYGGFNVDLRWKDLSFQMAWSYKYGHYIFDNCTDDFFHDGYVTRYMNIAKGQVDCWTPENRDAKYPKRIASNGQSGNYYDSDNFLFKGDYLRLKNATVSYNLPKTFVKKANISNARVYLAGANLLTFSGLHVDPEIQQSGYYSMGMPAMRTVTFGVEVSF